MRAAVTRGGRLVLGDVPEPVPSSGHVVVRSLSAGICGSDLHALADFPHFTGLMDSVGVPALDPGADCVFGHEFCAEIVEHGPDTAGTLPVGSRVCSVPIILGPTGVEQIGYSNAYPGALAEHMVLQELLLLPVPDALDTDLAALTEPLAVGEHAVGLADLHPGQPCLVVGCGPVGLAVIAALKGRGHGPVLAADFSPTRRRLAEAFGADEVIDPAAGVAARPLVRFRHRPHRHGAHRLVHAGRVRAGPCHLRGGRRPRHAAVADRRRAAAQPDRGGRRVHAHRHH